MVRGVMEKVESTSKKESIDDSKLMQKKGTIRGLISWRQIKYISKFLTRKEKIAIRIALGVIIFSLGAMGYLFVDDNMVEKPRVGGSYTEIVVGSPQYINPLYSSIGETDRDLVRLVFAGLVRFDENQNIAPDLAHEWFLDDKGTTYTFQLRDNVYWPDEKQFTSYDVVFTIEAIQNELFESPIRDNWLGIEAKAIDEFTVQFTLPEPFSPFIENATVGILPAHLWEEIQPENARLAELNIKPVGLGPYLFDELTKDKQGFVKSYKFVRNENYHLGAPYIEEVVIKFQPTFEMATDSLKNRNADGMSFLPINLKESLESRKDLSYISASLPQYTAIFFNSDNNSNLSSIKFRSALKMAIDKSKIIETVLAGKAVAIDGTVLPGFPGYNDSKPVDTVDIETAKRLLSELGWAKKKIEVSEPVDGEGATSTEVVAGPEVDESGMSRFLYKGDSELVVSLTVANQPQAIAVGELIAKMWQSMGIRVNLNPVESSLIQKEVITPRSFEALLFGEILGANPDPYAFWHSSQAGDSGLNLSNFKNTDADKILIEMRKEEDVDKLAELYIQFDGILAKEIPAIFLYNPNYTYVVDSKVKGIDLKRIVSPADRLNGIHSWYIKTRRGFK